MRPHLIPAFCLQCNAGSPATSFWLECFDSSVPLFAAYDGSIKYCQGDGCEGPCGDETRFTNGECMPAGGGGGGGGAKSVTYSCIGMGSNRSAATKRNTTKAASGANAPAVIGAAALAAVCTLFALLV